MMERRFTEAERFFSLMALHQYFLNADFMRDVFMRRIGSSTLEDNRSFQTGFDAQIAMSLWYSTVFVVIEGWRESKLSDPEVDALLADEDRLYRLKRFRHQVFHYQKAYDNPKLLEFLGATDADARAAVKWIGEIHAALGRATAEALQEVLDARRTQE